jgi:6,7-dimethyl-8-ribityllumazine synthase
MPAVVQGQLSSVGVKVAIIAGRFNAFIVDRLIDGAVDTFVRTGARDEDITVFRAPGSFEIPQVLRRVVEQNRFDAIVCLGAVIRGGTPHFEYVAGAVTKGVSSIAQTAPVPVTFGVLTTDTIEQAIERAGTKAGNKGAEAAMAAIEMVSLCREMEKRK